MCLAYTNKPRPDKPRQFVQSNVTGVVKEVEIKSSEVDAPKSIEEEDVKSPFNDDVEPKSLNSISLLKRLRKQKGEFFICFGFVTSREWNRNF